MTDSISMYAVRDTINKGKGVFANKPIAKGTRIMCETPVMSAPSDEAPEFYDLEAQYLNVTTEEQSAILSLHNLYEYQDLRTRLFGMLQNNSMNTGDGQRRVVIDGSRLNHSCDPNARVNWHEALKAITVHAIKDISKNEKITMDYLEQGKIRAERRDLLQQRYHFSCSCTLCSLPLGQSNVVDGKIRRTEELRKISAKEDLNKWDKGMFNILLQRLWNFEEMVRLSVELGPSQDLYPLYIDSASLVLVHGDSAR